LASTGFASSARSGTPANRTARDSPSRRRRRGPGAGRFRFRNEVVMEIPYLQCWAVRGGGTLAQSCGLGNAKSLSNDDEILDSFAPLTRLWPSHISANPVNGDSAYLAAVFGREPWIAEFPLIWRMLPKSGPASAIRHDELIGNLGGPCHGCNAGPQKTGIWYDRRARPTSFSAPPTTGGSRDISPASTPSMRLNRRLQRSRTTR